MTSISLTSTNTAGRKLPMAEKEIVKIAQVLAEVSSVEKQYGTVLLRDGNGKIVKREFDVIGEKMTIDPAKISEKMRRYLLSPANQAVIAHHIVKLAALVRDTRGEEALTVVAVEVARECADSARTKCGGVSEWAVIEACRDYWKTGAAWYPAAGDLLKRILAKDAELKAALEPRREDSSGILAVARKRLGEAKARAWFKGCTLEGKSLRAPSSFEANFIRNHYMQDFSDVFEEVRCD